MDKNQRIAILKEALNKAIALDNIYKSNDFQNHLLPHLKKLSYVQPLNPKDYESKEEFDFALHSANDRASVYSELLNFLSQQEAAMNNIREKINKPEVSYKL